MCDQTGELEGRGVFTPESKLLRMDDFLDEGVEATQKETSKYFGDHWQERDWPVIREEEGILQASGSGCFWLSAMSIGSD